MLNDMPMHAAIPPKKPSIFQTQRHCKPLSHYCSIKACINEIIFQKVREQH